MLVLTWPYSEALAQGLEIRVPSVICLPQWKPSKAVLATAAALHVIASPCDQRGLTSGSWPWPRVQGPPQHLLHVARPVPLHRDKVSTLPLVSQHCWVSFFFLFLFLC
jgi:hypothetical protein